LVDTIRAGVETAFSAVPQLVTVGTYLRKTGDGTYDPATDEITPGAMSIPNVRFLKTAADVAEREASPIAITDVKFLIPRVDFPDAVEPTDTDQILPGDGQRYNVVATKFVPGDSLFIVFGRRA
jgi:hypothetical protein